MEILEQVVLGNTIQRWAVTGVGAVVATVVLRTILALLRSRAKSLAESTATQWDDVVVHALSQIRFSLIAPAVFMFASSTLVLPPSIKDFLSKVAITLLLVQAGISMSAGFAHWLDHSRRRRLATDPASVSGFGAIKVCGSFVIWSVTVLLALDNLGIDISTLVAGLGVSGIAVALAVQNILGDLFASLTIILDKPFVVGDFLKVGDYLGTVQNIGLKTTRLKSLSGEQLVFGNTDLLKSRIQNYGRMEQRRIAFSIGVTYDTSPEILERIPGIIQAAVEQQEKLRFDRSHFSGFGPSALVFDTVYHVDVPDYAYYMDAQQAIYLNISREFAKQGIEFAYPTQTVYVKDSRTSELATAGPSPIGT